MKISRYHTSAGDNPFEYINWTTTDVKVIDHSTKETIFSIERAEVPAHWSGNAQNILVSKYFRLKGVPESVEKVEEEEIPEWLRCSKPAKDAEFGGETSAKQVFGRLAGFWTYWGWKYGYFDEEADARAFYDEVIYALCNQLFAPNTPQWYNCLVPRSRILTPNGKYTAIEDLNVDDMVVTHKGNIQPILNTFRRQVDQPLYRISLRGHVRDTICCSPGHPIYGIKSKDILCTKKKSRPCSHNTKKCLDCNNAPQAIPEWIEAQDIEIGDYVVSRYAEKFVGDAVQESIDISHYVPDAKCDEIKICGGSTSVSIDRYIQINDDFMRICGYFLADGCAEENGRRIRFFLSKKDVDAIGKTLFNFFKKLGVNPIVTLHHNSDKASILTVHHSILSKLFARMFGTHAHNKKIPMILMKQSTQKLLQLVRGIIEGDGCIANNRIVLWLANRELIDQVSNIMYSLGYDFTVRNPRHVKGKFSLKPRAQYGIDVAAAYAPSLYKELTGAMPQRAGSKRSLRFGDIVLHRVNDIKKEQYSGFIHNIEVKDDNSYITEGAVVHNSGLNWAYGLTGPKKGYWRVNPETGEPEETQDYYTNPGIHACYINAVNDTLFEEGGIYELMSTEARCYVSGGGSGVNISAIRAKGELLSNGNPASGVMEFVKYLMDNNAKIIKSGSSQRKPANIKLLFDDHPEIEDFIDWKSTEEKKAGALMNAGYSGGLDGEAYRTVSGQSTNISVRITDKFMDALDRDNGWDLIARTTGEPVKSLRAAELWKKIVEGAHYCGDPGIQFHDTINEWHTCPKDGASDSSNPCFASDTLIYTKNGLKEVKALYEQYGNKCFDIAVMENGGVSFKPASVFYTGHKNILEIKTSLGSALKVTPDHKIFANGQWVEACRLKVGDELVISSEANVSNYVPIIPNELSGLSESDLFAFVGLVLADGWTSLSWSSKSYEVGVCFGKNDKDIMEKVTGMLGFADINYSVKRQSGSIGESPDYLRITRKFMVDWFTKLGWVGNRAHNKRVPKTILGASKDVQMALLSGLISGDGTINYRPGKDINLRISSASYDLLHDVHHLLLINGIISKIYFRKRPKNHVGFTYKNKVYSSRDYYELVVNGESLRNLKRMLPKLWSTHKQALLDQIPDTFDNGYDKHTCIVKGVTPCGEDDVFDISEPVTHTLIANGIKVHNCSEFLFTSGTACNLTSMNLPAFFDTQNRKFNVDEFLHASSLVTIILDISNTVAQLPSKDLAIGTHNYRAIGIGHTGLGSLLMKLGIPYDSPEAYYLGAGVTSLMTASSYRTSAMLASELGAFPRHKPNAKDMLRVIRNHIRASGVMKKELGTEFEGINRAVFTIDISLLMFGNLKTALRSVWSEAHSMGKEHGYRNAFVSLIQPSGSVSFVLDADTTAIEPEFSLVKIKKLSGGGYMKIINDSLQEALENLGYEDDQIDEMLVYLLGSNTLVGAPHINAETLIEKEIHTSDIEKVEKELQAHTELRHAFRLSKESLEKIGATNGENVFRAMGFTQREYIEAQTWILGHGTFEGAPHIKEEHLPIFDCANRSGVGERFLRWEAHVNMVSAVQPFISGAASKTVNVPREISYSVIDDILRRAYKSGIKCITTYRDGAKYAQPLSSAVDMTWWYDPPEHKVYYRGERRRPGKKRRGFCQEVTITGDGKEYKLWIQCFEYDDGTLCEVWLDVSKENQEFTRALTWWTRAISNAIQYGQPLSEIARSYILEEGGPSGKTNHPYITVCTSIPDFVFKFLALEYLGDTTWCRRKPPLYKLRCGKNGENGDGNGNKNGHFQPIHIVKTLKYPTKCPVCHSSDLQLYPCPTCRSCGYQIGDCST